jgi:hypothetical protein
MRLQIILVTVRAWLVSILNPTGCGRMITWVASATKR